MTHPAPAKDDHVIVTDRGLIIPEKYPGRVVKVGRTLVTISWDGREDQFRMADRKINDYSGEIQFEISPA